LWCSAACGVALGIAACGGANEENGKSPAAGAGGEAAGGNTSGGTGGKAPGAGAAGGGNTSGGAGGKAPGAGAAGDESAGGGAECGASCDGDDVGECVDGKQAICSIDVDGCSRPRTVDCVCPAGVGCFQVEHREWGDRNNSGANGVAFDSEGNVLVSASTIGALMPLTTFAGGRDVLVKWTPSLELSWALSRGTFTEGISRAVAVDQDDNAFLAAVYSLEDAPSGPSGLDVTITKIAPDGAELWSKTFGSTLYDEASELATDSDGNLIVGGFTYGKLAEDEALGESDALVMKLAPDGTRLWARQFGTAGSDTARGICVDADGDIYVTGAIGAVGEGSGDWYIAKLSSSGEQQWLEQLSTAGLDGGTGIACGADAVYAVGVTRGRLDDPNAAALPKTDLALVKYDLDGNQLWLKQWLTAEEERFPKVAVGPTGNVFLAGASATDLDGNPSSGPGGETDLFVSEWTAAGDRLWVYQYGSNSWDSVTGIAVSPAGRIAVAADVQAALPGFTISGDGDAVLTVLTPSP
jgi:hypothetical protein